MNLHPACRSCPCAAWSSLSVLRGVLKAAGVATRSTSSSLSTEGTTYGLHLRTHLRIVALPSGVLRAKTSAISHMRKTSALKTSRASEAIALPTTQGACNAQFQ
eukprot:4579408-Amphidinium_carterae.1